MVADTTPDLTINPSRATVGFGKTQQFTAQVPRKTDAAVTFQVVAGPGTIDANTGIYVAPFDPSRQLPARVECTRDHSGQHDCIP